MLQPFLKQTNILLPLTFILFCCACKKKKIVITEEEYQAPTVAFTWNTIPDNPNQVYFTNKSTKADSYRWSFGDGTTSTDPNPAKVTYSTPGTYEVMLTAVYRGKSSFVKKSIVIVADTDQPVARFSYAYKDNKTYPPTTIILTNESVNSNFFEWQINGSTVNSTNPIGTEQMQCSTPGNYTVKLFAMKGNKRSVVFEETIAIVADPNPIASFIPDGWISTRKVGEEVVFLNTSKNSNSWEWSFGTNGPTAITDEHAIVKFTNPGTYEVKLVAKRDQLTSAPYKVTMKIIP
ncbi:PKD domain-containing protein [Pedobacter frigoris]|uniref:PKD domain-containing protein n=1 Tax=Pedobacter frigoris TaxID=2571272 RepID=A0A4U1CKA2_9SPHI|nr:PKD domain-containing protein [Pedobacter frigoris]TKC07460.1 PKD domain-containing protein [Pedobacter frigoris]